MPQRRQRRIEDLQRRDLAERTQELAVRAVRQLAEQYHQSPDRITAEALRDDCLSLKNVKPYSRSARTLALCGLKLFSTPTWQRAWTTRTFVRPPREKTLPVLLRPTEVRTLLAGVPLPRDRSCRSTISAGGLRLPAGTHRPVSDRDAARMGLHVRLGQGAKARDVPLPRRILAR